MKHTNPSSGKPIAGPRPAYGYVWNADKSRYLLDPDTAPTVRLITYGDEISQACVSAIAEELSGLIARPCYEAAAVDEALLEPVSACALAGRLAKVFDACLS